MGVYIKGLNAPKSCSMCLFFYDDARLCMIMCSHVPSCEKPNCCPITEVKEPHGSLIDVDSLYESMSKWGAGVGDGILADAIEDTPVVIQECS